MISIFHLMIFKNHRAIEAQYNSALEMVGSRELVNSSAFFQDPNVVRRGPIIKVLNKASTVYSTRTPSLEESIFIQLISAYTR